MILLFCRFNNNEKKYYLNTILPHFSYMVFSSAVSALYFEIENCFQLFFYNSSNSFILLFYFVKIK